MIFPATFEVYVGCLAAEGAPRPQSEPKLRCLEAPQSWFTFLKRKVNQKWTTAIEFINFAKVNQKTGKVKRIKVMNSPLQRWVHWFGAIRFWCNFDGFLLKFSNKFDQKSIKIAPKSNRTKLMNSPLKWRVLSMCSGRLSRMKWRCGMWTILKETLNGARRHIDVTLDGDCRSAGRVRWRAGRPSGRVLRQCLGHSGEICYDLSTDQKSKTDTAQWRLDAAAK